MTRDGGWRLEIQLEMVGGYSGDPWAQALHCLGACCPEAWQGELGVISGPGTTQATKYDE